MNNFYFYAKKAFMLRSYLQLNYSICTKALHWIKLEITLEVACVQAGDGKAITKASLRE